MLLILQSLNILCYTINGTPECHDILTRFGLLDTLILRIQKQDENDNHHLFITAFANILGANSIDKIYIKQGLPLLCKLLIDGKKQQTLGALRRIINKSDADYAMILQKCQIMATLIQIFK